MSHAIAHDPTHPSDGNQYTLVIDCPDEKLDEITESLFGFSIVELELYEYDHNGKLVSDPPMELIGYITAHNLPIAIINWFERDNTGYWTFVLVERNTLN